MKYIVIMSLLLSTVPFACSQILLKGQPLTEEQRRNFLLGPTVKQVKFDENVEQVRNIEFVLNLLFTGMHESPVDLEAIYGTSFEKRYQDLRQQRDLLVVDKMREQDSYGNTLLHKFAFLMDVDEVLYAQLPGHIKEKLKPSALTEKFKEFLLCGADFNMHNNVGQRPIDMMRNPRSVGARCLQDAFEAVKIEQEKNSQK